VPLERHIEAFGEAVQVTATLDVGAMWDRLLGEFLSMWTDLDRQGLSEAEMIAEMESFMGSLSSKPEEAMARQEASVIYNQGRRAEILTAGEQGRVSVVVRSEILDTETCQMCHDLDGIVREVGTPEYDRDEPPAWCEGGKNCRGFYVAIGHEA
jgi:hypothetical protein